MSSKRGQPHYRRHMRTHFALHGCRCRTHPLLSSPTRCRRRPSNERVMQMNRKKKPGAAPWQQRCLSWKRQAPKIGKWTRFATSCAAVSYANVTGVSRSWRLECERSVARGSCRGGSTDGFRPASFSGAGSPHGFIGDASNGLPAHTSIFPRLWISQGEDEQPIPTRSSPWWPRRGRMAFSFLSCRN